MPEKQRRVTNILLCLILLVLLAQLAMDLVPYIITGRILNSFTFSSSNSSTPFMTRSTQDPVDSWGDLFFGDTSSP